MLDYLPLEKPALLGSLCAHCGRVNASSSSRFCCSGCEAVYTMLQDRGLGRFYELRKIYGDSSSTPRPSRGEGFAYLDDPAFVSLFTESDGTIMRFYLEGVHCAACVWLTERLPSLTDGVRRADLSLASGIATVEIFPGASFARVAEAFARLGYQPHPIELGKAGEKKHLSNRRALLRIGVAATCAGNIMLFAIAIYAGAGDDFAPLFRWLSFLLFLPVLLFSAQPFFKSARDSIWSLRLSIDVPIAFGLFSGTCVSVVNLFRNSNEIYFDSLAGLVFLLLSSRYFLARVQASAADASHLLHFLAPSRARKLEADGRIREVRSDSLLSGDRIEILVGGIVPADGVIIEGQTELGLAWMTGESKTQIAGKGAPVLAGSLNESGAIVVEVRASGAATRLGEILRQTERVVAARSRTLIFSDRVARFFVPTTFGLIAIGFGVGFHTSVHEGIARAIAIAIVVCPCALAMAIPLAMSLSIGRLAKRGILVRGADVLERLSQIETVLFDKTGTLTKGVLTVSDWRPSRPGLESILLALESKSQHPIAEAVRTRFGHEFREIPEVSDLKEMLGVGVSGNYGTHSYIIRRSEIQGAGTEVSLYEDERLVGSLLLSDVVRENSREAVKRLRDLGFSVGILSGDNDSAVKKVAQDLPLSEGLLHSGLSPEDKVEIVRRHPSALMVGDGANDAPALAAASVGMAVHGGMEVSMRTAGIYGGTNDPMDIPRVIEIARETMRVVRRNLVFTLVYNVGVVAIALSGNLHPVVAAILMPLSAFAVFSLSVLGTRRMKALFQEIGR